MSTRFRYDNLIWPEIIEAVARNVDVQVPFGTIEEHVPHRPLYTDSIICLCRS
jgi:creatinine amidohydrolase/Fe(II)-dependent formamide hydrolase-like protein